MLSADDPNVPYPDELSLRSVNLVSKAQASSIRMLISRSSSDMVSYGVFLGLQLSLTLSRGANAYHPGLHQGRLGQHTHPVYC